MPVGMQSDTQPGVTSSVLGVMQQGRGYTPI